MERPGPILIFGILSVTFSSAGLISSALSVFIFGRFGLMLTIIFIVLALYSLAWIAAAIGILKMRLWALRLVYGLFVIGIIGGLLLLSTLDYIIFTVFFYPFIGFLIYNTLQIIILRKRETYRKFK